MSFCRKYGLIISALAVSLSAGAQKKQYTMAEATNGITTTLAPRAVKQPGWIGGSLAQIIKGQQEEYYVLYNPDTKRADTVCTLSEINEYLRDSLKTLPVINYNKDQPYFIAKGRLHYLVFKDRHDPGKLVFRDAFMVPEKSENIHLQAFDDGVNYGEQMVYTIGNNLYLKRRYNKRKDPGAWERSLELTKEENPNIINGQSVHRNEFGIDNGIFISPKGNLVAYYRMDQTMVADYPVIDWSGVPAKNENVKYPMAGRTSHEVTVRVYDPKMQQTIELQTGEHKDHYLTCVTWSPDEQYVYLAILNRAQNHLWLNQYSAKTGKKIKTLFEETDDKYVEPQHPLAFLPGSNDQFVWWSQRDGYMHLYLYNMDGRLIRQITKGPWVVNELLAFNKERNEIIFSASKEDPREKHGYTVNWKTGEWSRIDNEPGTHNFTASDDGKYVFDVLTARGVAKKSMIRATDGSMTKVLIDAPDPLNDYERPEIRDVKLKAEDGTRLYGKLILPTNFDPQKKYPVIVYLYNGPHVQLIKNGFPESGNLWYEYLAQHGYIVWTMDGRGSGNRGLAFEQAVFRRLGTVEMEDQLVGVDFLKSLPYVDAGRLGIHGWSFGGFMAASMMLRHPGVFKCAVAGGPVLDWSMYEVMYGERYMDTPEENPKGYANSNLLTKVKNLKGKLLLIHGTQDATVVWQHSINFIKKSVDEGVQVDYFVYPGYEHNVRGKDRVHLMQKVTDYFDDHL